MNWRLIGRAAGWGTITPAVVLATFLVLTWWISCCVQLRRVSALFDWPIKEPYQLIFAFGIICSLWAQSTITCYFDDRDFFQSTKLSKAVEKSLRFEIPLILGFLVLLSLMSLDYFNTHICFNLLYLAIVAGFDLFYWKQASARNPENKKDAIASEEFRKCCRHLFWHVDLVLLAPILASFAFVSYFPAPLPSFIVDREKLALPSGVSAENIDRLVASINSQWSDQSHAFSDQMKHTFMSGVIGVLLLLTVMLIFFRLREWEMEKATASSAPDRPCVTDPPHVSGGSHDPGMAAAIEMHETQQYFLRPTIH